jgi:hypothetical protein
MSLPKIIHFHTTKVEIHTRHEEPAYEKVFSVGSDMELLSLREKILQADGFMVRSMDPIEAEADAHLPYAHLWIFCNTVDPVQRVYLACCIRRNSPESKLILLEGARPAGFESVLFHRILKVNQGVDALLSTLHELAA